ncbi:MAG: alpha/beta hydrolase [Gammaproteobacteria bacterium]
MIDYADSDACLELEPAGPVTASVIWLHGLGADGHDFVPVAPELKLPPSAGIRFVFPHAPYRPVTINGGMRMRAWYDIVPAPPGWREDPQGIRESADRLRDLIQREVQRGVPTWRLVLAGFSQGGAVVLHTALRYPERLAGVLALSTYLPMAETCAAEIQPPGRDVPIFMAHGSDDPVIPLAAAERSRRELAGLGCRVEWRCYPMPHSVCPTEVQDIGRWLRKILAPDKIPGA